MEQITRAESVEIDEILRLIIKDEFPLGVQLVYGRPASLLSGLLLLTMSRVVRSLKPCESDLTRFVHEPIFFLAIYLISIGTRGHKPSLESFGANQFDDENHYTIWYMCITSCNFFS
ncbi:hypothetical protein R3W88_027757 [Solanum pinnatisectum]|uniref:Uncharacterized protein n=1 Tax=Solanum pinnatisectum TaxID=50273 RepID=A0AAV9LI49_9SOLN|nr:hypothetical protein R3W88_027757 [Solanum pinnatisectum]